MIKASNMRITTNICVDLIVSMVPIDGQKSFTVTFFSCCPFDRTSDQTVVANNEVLNGHVFSRNLQFKSLGRRALGFVLLQLDGKEDTTLGHGSLPNMAKWQLRDESSVVEFDVLFVRIYA